MNESSARPRKGMNDKIDSVPLPPTVVEIRHTHTMNEKIFPKKR